MASLQSRLSSLITAIGADIKSLTARGFPLYNAGAGSLGAGFATETTLTGSIIAFPQGKIQAGTRYRLQFTVSKTAAGIAAPVIAIKVGPNGNATDTTRVTLTFAAQTAAIDEGKFEIEGVFNAGGAAAAIYAQGNLLHRLATTGLNVTSYFTRVIANSGTFDVTGAGLKISTTVNGGTNAAWTINVVSAELVNLAP
jgi:hypothetical protein